MNAVRVASTVRPARRAPTPEARENILDVVTAMLEAHSYEGVQLREVACQAHVSLARIYKIFGTRDELLVAAVARWMDRHAYSALEVRVPPSVHDGLVHLFRAVFEPWQDHPRMLAAFHRARSGPGGKYLVQQGTEAIRPVLTAVLAGTEPAYRSDIEQMIGNLFYAVFGRFADGDLDIAEVLPTLERAAYRLTADNTDVAAPGRSTRP